jgi:hypothetical protein
MATHGLLLFNLKHLVVNFWCKYYNHTLTYSLQQLISNLKIFSQRKMHKRKKPQKFCRTSSTSKSPQFAGSWKCMLEVPSKYVVGGIELKILALVSC